VDTVLDIAYVKRLEREAEFVVGKVTKREVRFAKALDAVLTALDEAPDQTNLAGVRQLVREAIEGVK
jgi:hypothetical protein